MAFLQHAGSAAIVCVLVVLALAGCAQSTPAAPTVAAPKPAGTSAAPAPATTAAAPAPATSVAAPATSAAAPAAAPKPAAATPAAAAPTGELRIALGSFTQEKLYPPLVSSLTFKTLLSPVFDTWVRGFAAEVEPGVVEKWQIAPDGRSWTFNLRKGIKFHNGDELTADDMIFSIEKHMAPDANYAGLRNSVERMEKIDSYTVRVHTKGVLPFFTDMIGFSSILQAAVMPKSYFEKNGLDYVSKNPVGTGPWKFVRYVPGDRLEFEAVENHWRQTPAFKKLTLVLMPEEATRVAALKTGTIDITDIGLDTARELEAAGYRTQPTTSVSPAVFFFGTYDKRAAGMPAADVRVRQALSLAINRQEIGKGLFYGKTGPVMPPFLSDVSSDLDVAYWRDQSAKLYRYDPAEAKRLLAQAGYPNGFSFKFYTSTIAGAAFLGQVAQIIQSQWGQVGVKAELVNVDYGAFQTMYRSGPDEKIVGQAFMGRNSAVTPSISQLRQGFSKKFATYNVLGSPAADEIDAILEQANSEVDAAKRKPLIAKATQMGIDTWAVYHLEPVPSLIVQSQKIDFSMPENGAIFPTLLAENAKPKR